jgi:hypothetical protein
MILDDDDTPEQHRPKLFLFKIGESVNSGTFHIFEIILINPIFTLPILINANIFLFYLKILIYPTEYFYCL